MKNDKFRENFIQETLGYISYFAENVDMKNAEEIVRIHVNGTSYELLEDSSLSSPIRLAKELLNIGAIKFNQPSVLKLISNKMNKIFMSNKER